ncbi:MAG: hypothetical protein II717_01260 [Lachnospiraceae bacterium]|nr:hypothetical protein [Lachnospiraceae bacterium]
MNENLTRINELEKRVREELSELDSLASIIESGDDEFVKNKLKYLQAELDYLNNQSKLLNEYVEKKSAVSKSQYVSSDTIVREDIQTDTAIVSESISQPEAVAQEIITEVESEESRISLDESPVIEKEIVNDDDLLDISLQEENFDPPKKVWKRDAKKPEVVRTRQVDVVATNQPNTSLPTRIWVREDKPIPPVVEAKKTVKPELVEPESVEPKEVVVEKVPEEPQVVVENIVEEKPQVEVAEKIVEEKPQEVIIEKEEPVSVEEPVIEEKVVEPVVEEKKEEAPKIMPLEDFEIEETIEIKSIPKSIIDEPEESPKEKKKKVSIENRIGLWVMPILAATLIFISVILLANALPGVMGDIIKQATMVVAGFSFAGIGVLLKVKKKGGAFGQVLMAIGVGELFITLVVSRFVFKSISDLWLFILIFFWSAALIILKRYSSILFQSIGEIGVSIAVIFGVSYSLAVQNHGGVVVVLIFYALTALIYYFLFKFRGSLANKIIYHSFNLAKLTFLSVAIMVGAVDFVVPTGIMGLICAVLGLIFAIDILVMFRGDATFDKIAGPFAVFFYTMQFFTTALIAALLLVANYSVGANSLFGDVQAMIDTVLELRWIAILAGTSLVGILLLLTEFIWKEKTPKYVTESILLFILVAALACSHPTVKVGFVIMIALLTLLGYVRDNHVLKISALVFYIGYAFLPGENVLRIAVGLLTAIAVISLLYLVREQYVFAYKVSVYFSLILYAITVSFSAFENSSLYGIKLVVIVAFVSLLNLIMMFTLLAKNKDKDIDFAIIPEIINIGVTVMALVLSMVVQLMGGSLGFVALIIAFVMIIVSIFRGYLQRRILCRINAIVSLFVGTITLAVFDYSAFWFATIAIGLAIAIMYIKKDRYNIADKTIYYLLTLAYAATSVFYFREGIAENPALNFVSIWIAAALVIILIFQFTGLAKTSDRILNDFSPVTFVSSIALVITSLFTMEIGEESAILLPFICMSLIIYVWMIDGFVTNKINEKIAVIVALFAMVFECMSMSTGYVIVALSVASIYLLLLYIKKDTYYSIFKYLIYGYLLLNCIVIPVIYDSSLSKIELLGTQGVVLIALMLVTLLFKFTILRKNPKSGETDTTIMAFIADSLTIIFATVVIIQFSEIGNYIPTAVLAIMVCIWLIHGFVSKKMLYKIAFIATLLFMLCTSWAYIPTFYTAITVCLIIIFLVLLYSDKESYSVWYKLPVFLLALANCIACPILYRTTIGSYEWPGVARIILLALFLVNVIFKFSPLSKDPETNEEDHYWSTYISSILTGGFAMALIAYYKDADNYTPAVILLAIILIWLFDGFLKDKMSEKIAALVSAYAIATISMTFVPGVYVAMSAIIIVLFLFLLYRAADSYSFTFKWFMYALLMINSIIWPCLFIDSLNELNVFVAANVVFVLMFIVNTLFMFTPLVKNPESDVRDMLLIVRIASHVLIAVGIAITFLLEAPADILTSILTLALVPMGTAWIWKDDENDETILTVGKYLAVTEYVFVPFVLCYAMSAPAYVSSIVGIILAVGCIVLGFVMKMKGVRIYGLVVSMIMIFKLALVDFEKTSVLAYALSFFIAGISCLVISMLYYFVNAAVAKSEAEQ